MGLVRFNTVKPPKSTKIVNGKKVSNLNTQVKAGIEGRVRAHLRNKLYLSKSKTHEEKYEDLVSIKTEEDAWNIVASTIIDPILDKALELDQAKVAMTLADLNSESDTGEVFLAIKEAAAVYIKPLGFPISADEAGEKLAQRTIGRLGIDTDTTKDYDTPREVIGVLGRINLGKGNKGPRFATPTTRVQDVAWLASTAVEGLFGIETPPEVQWVVDFVQLCANMKSNPVGVAVVVVATVGVDLYDEFSKVNWQPETAWDHITTSLEVISAIENGVDILWEFWEFKTESRKAKKARLAKEEAVRLLAIRKAGILATRKKTKATAALTSDSGLPSMLPQHHTRMYQYDESMWFTGNDYGWKYKGSTFSESYHDVGQIGRYWMYITKRSTMSVKLYNPFHEPPPFMSDSPPLNFVQDEHIDPATGARRLYPTVPAVPGFEVSGILCYRAHQVATMAGLRLTDPNAARPPPASVLTNSNAAFFFRSPGDQTVGHNLKGALSDSKRVPYGAVVGAATRSAFAVIDTGSNQVWSWGHPRFGGLDAAHPVTTYDPYGALPWERGVNPVVVPAGGNRAVGLYATDGAFLLLSRSGPGNYSVRCWGAEEKGGFMPQTFTTSFTGCMAGGPRVLATRNLWCVLPHYKAPVYVWGGVGHLSLLNVSTRVSSRTVTSTLVTNMMPNGHLYDHDLVSEHVLGPDVLQQPVHHIFAGASDNTFYFIHGPDNQLSVLGPASSARAVCPPGVTAVVPGAMGSGALALYGPAQRFIPFGGSGLRGHSAPDVATARIVRAVASGRSFALVLASGSLLFLGPVLGTFPETPFLHPSDSELEAQGRTGTANMFGALPTRSGAHLEDVGWSQFSSASWGERPLPRPFTSVVGNAHGAFVALRPNAHGRRGLEAHLFGPAGVGGRLWGSPDSSSRLLQLLRHPQLELRSVVACNRGFAALFSNGRVVYWGDLGTDPKRTDDPWDTYGTVTLAAEPEQVIPLENGFAFVSSGEGAVVTVGAMVTDCLPWTRAKRKDPKTLGPSPYQNVTWVYPSALGAKPGRTPLDPRVPVARGWHEMAHKQPDSLRRFAPELVLSGWMRPGRVPPVNRATNMKLPAGGGSLPAGECYDMCRLFDRFGQLPLEVPFPDSSDWPWDADDAESALGAAEALGFTTVGSAVDATPPGLDPLVWLFVVAPGPVLGLSPAHFAELAHAVRSAEKDDVVGTACADWVETTGPGLGLTPFRSALSWLAVLQRLVETSRGNLGGLTATVRAGLLHGLTLLDARGQPPLSSNDPEVLTEVDRLLGLTPNGGEEATTAVTVRFASQPSQPPATAGIGSGEVVTVATSARLQLPGTQADAEGEYWLFLGDPGLELTGMSKLPVVTVGLQPGGVGFLINGAPTTGSDLDLGQVRVQMHTGPGSIAALLRRTEVVPEGLAAVVSRKEYPAPAGTTDTGRLVTEELVASNDAAWPWAGPELPAVVKSLGPELWQLVHALLTSDPIFGDDVKICWLAQDGDFVAVVVANLVESQTLFFVRNLGRWLAVGQTERYEHGRNKNNHVRTAVSRTGLAVDQDLRVWDFGPVLRAMRRTVTDVRI